MWGTRGSIATPGPSTLRYGGNTSCVELRTDDGTIAVLDCGTGARELGRALVAESNQTISGALNEAIADYVRRRRVRPAVLAHLEDSLAENEELGRLLAR